MIEIWFSDMAERSIDAVWLILAVWLIRLVMGRRWRNAVMILWMFVGIRLLIPASIESSFSLVPQSYQKIEPVSQRENVSMLNDMAEESMRTITFSFSAPVSEKKVQVSSQVSHSSIQVLSILWCSGIFILVSYMIFCCIMIQKKVKSAVKVSEIIWESDQILSPFVMGIIKPRIYLPTRVSDEERKYVTAHEKEHIKGWDHGKKMIAFMIFAFYWLNPFIWVCYRLFCKDIELACDERIVKNMNAAERKQYATILLNYSIRQTELVSGPLAFGKGSIKQRIACILYGRKPTFVNFLIVGIVCMLISVCFMTDPVRSDEIQNEDPFYSNEKLNGLTEKRENVIEEQEQNLASRMEQFVSDSFGNQYYNVSAKSTGKDVYIEVPEDGLYVLKEDGTVFEKIYDGIIALGTLTEDFLYFYDYSDTDHFYINAINLLTYESVMAYTSEDLYTYHEMMSENDKLYIAAEDGVMCFQINGDGTLTEVKDEFTEKKETYFSPIVLREAGMAENVQFEDINQELVGDFTLSDGNSVVLSIPNVTDIMITPIAVVGRMAQAYKDVYAWSLTDGSRICLYSADLHGNTSCSYNTYDEAGIYGVAKKKDGLYSIIQITWNGQYRELTDISSRDEFIHIRVKLSAVNGWLYFYDPAQNKMKRININQPNMMEIID